MAAAGRPVKLIYRAPFGEGPGHTNGGPLARAAIEKTGIPADDLLVQIKFNWSHGKDPHGCCWHLGCMLPRVVAEVIVRTGHSTTTFVQAHGGGTGESYYVPPVSAATVGSGCDCCRRR